jgi:hypothetical protein
MAFSNVPNTWGLMIISEAIMIFSGKSTGFEVASHLLSELNPYPL